MWLGVLILFSVCIAFAASIIATYRFSLFSIPLDWITEYYLALLFILLCVSIFSYFVKNNNKQNQNHAFPENYSIHIFLLSILAVFTRFYQLDQASIWLDEDMQIGRMMVMKDFVAAAAVQHQPPLAYFITWWGADLFGMSVWGVRFFSAFFGVLAVPLFFHLSWTIHQKIEYAWAAAIVFLLHAWMVGYSQELRPYSMGIFFFILFLLSINNLFANPTSMKNKMHYFVATELFLLSLGMQPILLVSIVILFLFFLLREEKSTHNRRSMIVITFIALVLFFPIQKNIITLSTMMLQPVFKFSQIVSSFRETAYLLNQYLWRMEGPLIIFGFLFICIKIFHFQISKKIKNSVAYSFGNKEKYIIFLWILFPIVFLISYSFTVNLPMQDRYVILHIPLSILASLILIHYCVNNILLPNAWKPFVAVYYIIFLFYYAHSFAYYQRNRNPIFRDADWQVIHKKLEENTRGTAIAHIVTLHKESRWTIHGFIGVPFYQSKNKKIKIYNEWEAEWLQKYQAEQIWENSDSSYQQIFLVFPRNYLDADIESYLLLLSGGKVIFSNQTFTLVEVENRFGYAQSIQQFFATLLEQETNPELRMPILRILVGLAAENFHYRDFILYRQELEATNKNGFYSTILDPSRRAVYQLL